MTASHSIIHSLIQQTFIESQPYAGTENAKVKNTKPCFQECPSPWHLLLPFAVSAVQGNSSCVTMLACLATPFFWMSWSKIFKVGAWVGTSWKWFYRNLLTRAKGTHFDISPSRSSDEMMQSKSSSHHTWQQCFLFSTYWIKPKIIIPPPRPCPT